MYYRLYQGHKINLILTLLLKLEKVNQNQEFQELQKVDKGLLVAGQAQDKKQTLKDQLRLSKNRKMNKYIMKINNRRLEPRPKGSSQAHLISLKKIRKQIIIHLR